MLVSVVIPVYNRKNFIRQCLESVINQDFNGDYEIIVIDDGSTDGTLDILKEYSSRVKVHSNTTNQGVSFARNYGVRLSQGEFVAMIDSDTMAYPNWLSELIYPFGRDKDIMIVGGKVTDIVDNNYWQIVNKGFNTFIAKTDGYVDRVIGCNMAIRRKFAVSYPYDERLKFAAGDDTGLCWLCRNKGFNVFYTDSARVDHHSRNTLISSLLQQFLYGYVNTYLCIKFFGFPYVPNGPRVLVLLLLCLLLLFMGFTNLWVVAAVLGIIFSYMCWYHGTKASVKTGSEAVLTYPGNYLLYTVFCIGTLVYFLFPRAFLKTPKPICVGFASDDRYVPYLGAVLVSLFKNNPNEHFDIFVMNTEISAGTIDKLNLLLKKFPNARINWITCDTALFNGFRVDGHISLAAYYRILLPQFIPESYDKCLYLDCDTLIVGSIRTLWETDLENYALAAVQDSGSLDRKKELGPLPSEKYFNSGVMLINLGLWRKEPLALNVIDFIRKNPSKIMYYDQDGLNAVLFDRWKPLNECWNKTVYGRPFERVIKEINLNPLPKIIHFASSNKPWFKENTHYPTYFHWKFFYFKYLSQTPWKDLVRQQNNFYDSLVQWCYRFVSFRVFIMIKKIKWSFQGLMKSLRKAK